MTKSRNSYMMTNRRKRTARRGNLDHAKRRKSNSTKTISI